MDLSGKDNAPQEYRHFKLQAGVCGRPILALQAARGYACITTPASCLAGVVIPAAVLGFRSRWSLKLSADVRRFKRYRPHTAATFRSWGAKS
jgi:hypothetical protein